MSATPPEGDTPPAPDPSDCFGPPAEPCECWCMHCRRTFMSDRIWWQREILPGGKEDGMWLCPTPNCDGAGFTFDLFPTDPAHPANEGWHSSDDNDNEDDEEEGEFEDGEEEADADAAYDPAEPGYAALDDEAAAHGDVEGEEWKHGLSPGEAPPEPAWVESARRERAAEEARYDQPDERPRVVDRSHEPPPAEPAGDYDEANPPF